MGKIYDASEIARITAEIYTDSRNNLTFEEAKKEAIAIYEAGKERNENNE